MKTASLALTRRLAAPVFGAVLAAIAQSPAAADAAGAEAFVRALADDAIAILTDPALTDEALTAEFRAFVAAGFDVPVVARFALGPYWRPARRSGPNTSRYSSTTSSTPMRCGFASSRFCR